MDWNDLRFFLAVAAEQSLAGAARRLQVNHSTVFRRLNVFEERLGVRLFERFPDGYVLTEAGERLLSRAKRVEAEFDSMGRELSGLDARLSGPIRLTTAPVLARRYMPPILRDFRVKYPEVVVELSVSAENRDLSRREADLALRATSQPPEYLSGRKAVEFSWWVFAGEAWLEHHPRPEQMNDVAEYDFIAAGDALARLPAFQWAERHLPTERIAARSNDLDAMAALAIAGVGLALLPQDQTQLGLVRLFPLTPTVTTHLWLLTHPDLRRIPRIRVLMEFIVERLRTDPRLAPAQTDTVGGQAEEKS